MHEIGLMTAIFEQVTASAAENNIERVAKVKLVVGRMNGALPDALDFAFTILAPGTIFEGGKLEIEEKDVTLECPKCGAVSEVGKVTYFCPRCSARAKIKTGQELYIDYYEGDQEGKEDDVEGSAGAAHPAG